MKRENTQLLRDVIIEMSQSYHLKEKMNEVRLVQQWETLFGKTISKYTTKLFVNNKKLYLTVSSASLRQEIMYSRDKMVERINKEIGDGFIREVVIR